MGNFTLGSWNNEETEMERDQRECKIILENGS